MNFTEFGLHAELLSAIDKLGFESCTPIQEKTIPHILSGGDIAGLAQTGTGKTAAFLLPLIHRVLISQGSQVEHPNVSADDSAEEEAPSNGANGAAKIVAFDEWKESEFVLVLVPTRELADQCLENFNKFTTDTGLRACAIYGGTSYDGQKKAIKDGVQFVFATPGRLIDLYKEHVIDFRQIRAVVFDEADRMFDMGFKDDMRYILRRIPDSRQILLFSATLNLDVLNIAYEFGANPTEIDVSRDQLTAKHVEDKLFHVGQDEKPKSLLAVLKKHPSQQVIIFSNFKANVPRIEKFLNDNGFPALGISSILTQKQRNRVMEQFKADGGSNILVATDVAARGLDIKGVDLVINYELPQDAENYVHRIGRTGRAGAEGLALSLVSDLDVYSLSRIEDYTQKKVEIDWLDDEELKFEFKSFPRNEERVRRGRDDRGKPRGKGGPKGKTGGKGKKKTGKRPHSGKDGDAEKSEHRDRNSNRHRKQGARFEDDPKKSGGGKKRKKTGNKNHKKKSGGKKHKSAKSSSRPAQKKPEPGIMGKVSGFFKKMFS